MGLDDVELVMALEEAFGVQLTDEEAVQSVTPRKIGDVIFVKLQVSCPGQWTREQVSALVKRVVLEQLGMPEAKYREDAHFVRDLGLGR